MPSDFHSIPTTCTDARGKRVPLFNPTLRRGRPPADLEISPEEWAHISARCHFRPTPTAWYPLIAFAFLVPLALWLISGNVLFALIGLSLPFVLIGIYLVLRFIASRTWGVVAFVDVAEQSVIDTMLSIRRCPSCAYKLPDPPATAPGAETTCPECGAAWSDRIADKQ